MTLFQRKLSLREMKSLAQGHRGDKGQSTEGTRSAELPGQVYATKMRAEMQVDNLNCLEKTQTINSCEGRYQEYNRALHLGVGQLCLL